MHIILKIYKGCPEIIVPRLFGYCEGAVESITSVFIAEGKPHLRIFETLFESI